MAIEILSKTKARLIVSVGSTSKGSRRRVTKTVTYSGKKDLNAQYAAFEAEVRRNPLTTVTVDALLSSYIANAEVRGLSVNTIHGYKSAQKRIIKAFPAVLARNLTTYQIDDFIAEMAKKYSPKTIANTIGLLDAAYQRAVRSGQLAENPCVDATLPKKKKAEIKTLPPDQIDRFVGELKKQPLDIKVGYELCLMCGLRRGEVLGLREKDVHTAFRQIGIERTRYIVEGKQYVQETKTERSHRHLAIPKLLADEIDQLIKAHHDLPYYHSDFLIQDPFGDPLSPSVFSGKIGKIEKAGGIDHVTAHGLRHTFATLLNSVHVDPAKISAELGHCNLTTTLNIYTHVFGDATSSSRDIADLINEIFDKKDSKRAQDEDEKTAKAL